MPTRLQQARYDGLLRRVGDLKGPGSKVSEVLGEVFPVLNLENLPSELFVLAGWQLGFGSVGFVASAAEVNIAQLFNPAASGHLIVLTRVLMVSQDSAQRYEYDTSSTPLADLFASSKPRDTRKGVISPLVGQLRQTQQPGSLSAIGQVFMRGAVTFDLRDDNGLFVLGPGTGISFGSTSVNLDSIFNFHWRERLAEPSELNF